MDASVPYEKKCCQGSGGEQNEIFPFQSSKQRFHKACALDWIRGNGSRNGGAGVDFRARSEWLLRHKKQAQCGCPVQPEQRSAEQRVRQPFSSNATSFH